MNDIYNVLNPLAVSADHFFKNSVQVTGELAGRGVEFLQNLPNEMKQNNQVAIAVFGVANAAFFTLANLLTKWCDRRIEGHTEELGNDSKVFKAVFLNGFVMGGTV